MKNIDRRMYGYDPVYDRMDRKELLNHYDKIYPVNFPEDFALLSRGQIIDSILGAEVEAWHETFDEPEEYPLRRLEEKWGPATTLTREKGQRLYWSWAGDSLEAAKSLVTDVETYPWTLVEGIREGDLILTVLDTVSPLVVAFEVAGSVTEEAVPVERLATFSNPISVTKIEEKLDISLPRSSEKLDAFTADKVLSTIAELIKDPQPIFITAGACSPSGIEDEKEMQMIGAISLLQQGEVDSLSCDACGRQNPSPQDPYQFRLIPHVFRPVMEDVLLDIQDHVDDTALLCTDCHTIAHQPTLKQLRDFTAAPPCPGCGERNPKSFIWGMPAGPPSDNHVVAGCDIPPGILPEWMCRDCDTRYGVVAFPEDLGVSYIDSQNNPVFD
ncbi:hypothetical protein ACIGB6_15415 [Paeniglutamicibacter gangotriensis]|uniref:hypothetical protein n=1 Tax=Paeniglutamicibacter gangotriensis TaxID=254787 RepID=UPI0037CA250F